MHKAIIGLDIGGTKIRAGIIDKDGRIIGTASSIPTCAHEPCGQIIANIFSLLHQLLDKVGKIDIQGIGVGCTGPLDNKNGIILEVANLPTLNNFPLKECLEREFLKKVVMDNDANALILGEAIYGAARGVRSVLGLTLGTGLGCAFVHDRKIWQGHFGCAGEIWTSPYKHGIIEDYVSGNAISRCYEKLTGVKLSALQIAEKARIGDSTSRRVWRLFSEDLAHVLSWMINMVDPEMVVLGGSLVKSADLFWEYTDKFFRKQVCRPVADRIKLKPSILEDNAGILGAAALFL